MLTPREAGLRFYTDRKENAKGIKYSGFWEFQRKLSKKTARVSGGGAFEPIRK